MLTSTRSSFNKQAGLAPMAIVIAVVLVAVAAGGYFFLTGKSGKEGIGIPAGLTLNSNCKYNDPDLCKFINNFKITNSYIAKSVATDKSNKKMEFLFESVGENKTHIVYSEAGKENYNVITIDDTTYTKDYADNKWWKQKQLKQEKQLQDQTDPRVEIKKSEEQPQDKTTYKKIGMEACGSLQCFKYQILNPDNSDTTEYIWFDNRDYLLRRERSEAKDGSATETDMTYSGVNVNAPSPTKDAKPDQIILPSGAVPGMSQKDLQDLQNAAAQPAVEAPVPQDNSAPVDNTPVDSPQ